VKRSAITLALLATLLLPAVAPATAAGVVVVPEAFAFKLHLMRPVSSAKSKPGEGVAFEMSEPIVVAGETIVERGAKGHLTVVVSGHAGSSGHEGDLTLRFDGVDATQGRHLVFDRQVIEINGHNNKVASAVLGFTPIVGLGARFIRGKDVTIEPSRVMTTILLHPATARPDGTVFAAPAPH
jgi:hypothetical protein